MKKKSILFLFLISLLFPSKIYAQTKASRSSATLIATQQDVEADYRVKVLRGYLKSKNSPLAENAESFVTYADKYNLDWRLVASISGVESTFGQQLPPNSYNAWGWGIYEDNMITFKSYDEAIETISKSLREQYMDSWKAEDVYDIGHYYAASPTWAQRVEYFMNKMRQYELNNPSLSLSLSL